MKNIINDIKNIVTGKKEISTKDAFALMNKELEEAEKAFFAGYQEADGKYIPSTSEDYEAIDFLAGCRLLELAQSYWGYIDGIRDTWGQDMKDLLFRYMETGIIDYDAIGGIWRQRDKQPLTPARP